MPGEYLIVDDEPDLCWALAHILASAGLPCQTALTAQAALDLMKHHRFQLAFLDLTLTNMNGLELARRLRQRDPLLRMVIISGYLSAHTAALEQSLAEGLICACITKPFLHEEILGALAEWAAPGAERCGTNSAQIGKAIPGMNSRTAAGGKKPAQKPVERPMN